MLTIYGADLSTPASKVRFVANYLNLPYEYRRVNLREGEQKQEWFIKVNPIGKVPAIDDNGFSLFESGAICRYLAEKAGNNSFYPKDLKQKAAVDQWTDFITLHIMINASKVVFNRVFAERMKIPASQESIADGIKFLDQYLPQLEKQLSQHKYVVNNDLTLADLTLLASLDPCEVAGIDLSKFPKITAWRNQLKQQEFYTKCYKEYGESLKQTAAK